MNIIGRQNSLRLPHKEENSVGIEFHSALAAVNSD